LPEKSPICAKVRQRRGSARSRAFDRRYQSLTTTVDGRSCFAGDAQPRCHPAALTVRQRRPLFDTMSKSKPRLSRRKSEAGPLPRARYKLGDVVRHRFYPFRGIIFNVDPVFNSTEEWWQSIPEDIRPSKDQPFYHLLAENEKTEYIAYVSEQNLLPDESGVPLRHPQVSDLFIEENGNYRATYLLPH
jgi:heat shock protein HspQ